MMRLVRHPDVKGVLVRVGVDSDRGNLHFTAGANDPTCDLAAIGDQDLFEHTVRTVRGSGWLKLNWVQVFGSPCHRLEQGFRTTWNYFLLNHPLPQVVLTATPASNSPDSSGRTECPPLHLGRI